MNTRTSRLKHSFNVAFDAVSVCVTISVLNTNLRKCQAEFRRRLNRCMNRCMGNREKFHISGLTFVSRIGVYSQRGYSFVILLDWISSLRLLVAQSKLKSIGGYTA